MTNGAFNSLDEIVDIESHNVNKMAKSLGILNPWRWKLIKTTSRDNARTPMQWTSGENAGFTTGKPWLKLNPNYKEINVERDLSDTDGIIAFFKKMNAYRKSSQVLLSGEFSELMSSKYVYAFERRLGDEALIAVFNFADKTKKLPEFCNGERVISNYTEPCGEGLRPYEFVLYKAGGSLND